MIRLIPIAAYVRIIGMNNLDETDPADEPRTFRQQSFPKRLVVMSGGSAMHFLQAFVLFVVVFAFVGVPSDMALSEQLGGPAPKWGISALVEGGAAERAGIRAGDEIVSIDGEDVDQPDEVRPLIVDRAGDRIPVVVRRGDEERTVSVVVGTNPDAPKEGLLGVRVGDLPSAHQPSTTVNPARAVLEAGRTTGDWMWQTMKGLGTFATGGLGDFARNVVGDDGDQGPVVSGSGSGSSGSVDASDENRPISIFGVARIGADAAENSAAELLLLLAVVNISIGIINLLPLLPFDGGHIAVAVYERLRSRKGRRYMADVSRLLPLTYAVVMLLGLLMVSSVYLDIVDPVGIR
jgi:membrane-associated protease RseP (regulator of RpoE activity)